MSQSQFEPSWNTSFEPEMKPTAEVRGSSELFQYFLLPALFHIPLVLVLRAFPTLGLFYVLLILIIGLFQLKRDKPDALILVSGYISSAELIWRMTNAPVFWETGKYLLVLLLGLGILRWRSRLARKPLFYFLVLIPSAILTLNQIGLSTARDYLSFNLSGPLLISVAGVFFSGISLTRKTFNRLLLIAIIPIMGVWTLAFSSTLSIERILFTNYSNFATSGGYGPNQLSALLGLGVLYCWLYRFNARPKGGESWLIISVGLALLAQAILTFSRGGVFNLVQKRCGRISVRCRLYDPNRDLEVYYLADPRTVSGDHFSA